MKLNRVAGSIYVTLIFGSAKLVFLILVVVSMSASRKMVENLGLDKVLTTKVKIFTLGAFRN